VSATRDKILATSRQLWNERGFADVTVAEIAARVGISTGNLSYHFPTKRELVEAVWDEAERRHLDLAITWRPETVLADFPVWIRSLCRVMWEYRFLYRDGVQLVATAPALLRRGRETVVQVGREQLRACLATLADGGHLRTDIDELPPVATNCWIVLRYWIDFLVEAREVRRIERGHVAELVAQFAALVHPHLTPAAWRSLQANLGEADDRSPADASPAARTQP